MTMRKITALFDSDADAQRAQERLLELGLPHEHISILDRNSEQHSSASAGAEHKGLWASIKEMFMPDEDRRTYEESIRRGGYLLIATVDDAYANEAIDAMQASNAVDLERRQDEWRAQGWTGQEPVLDERAKTRPDSTSQVAAAAEQTIPIVQERLRVGKREVGRGGVRVRSFVVEEPVQEQVRLREEHVDIERRPVNQPATPMPAGSPGDLLQERAIELTETAEEAVVAKEAIVTEELRVRKRADERVEQIDDTVRRTEVEVDDTRGGDQSAADVGRKKTTDDRPRRTP
jgi:uncharacterized protein (TIGR02271 family)